MDYDQLIKSIIWNMKQDGNVIYVGKQSLSRNMNSTHDYA